MFCYIIPVIRSNPCICLSLQSTVRPLQPFPDWMHLQCLAQLGDWGWINAEKFLFIMTCAGCFHHSVYYFIVFFTPESPLNDGQGCRSIRWPHIRMSCRASWKSQSRLSLIFFFPLPRLQITLAPPLIPLGQCRKRGQLHLRLPKQVYHCLDALSWLVGPLTWNVRVRQSGAIGAWRLAAGRDNLHWDTEQWATKDFQPLVDTSLKPQTIPIKREPCDSVASTVAGFKTALLRE